jgi:hypothetical protein
MEHVKTMLACQQPQDQACLSPHEAGSLTGKAADSVDSIAPSLEMTPDRPQMG